MFKIATWNINSLRVRLPQVLQWLTEAKPDVLALQETKVKDDAFPIQEINAAGYECVFSGQPSYNGMAILSKKAGTNVITEFPGLGDHQRRVLGMTMDDVRILNLYIPNGESVESEKYTYKLNWLKHLDMFLKDEFLQHTKFIILGDFNIAPAELDVHDPKAWEGKVICTDKERAAFHGIIDLGFNDCYRLHDPTEKSFSWWDYRLNAFKRNLGMRIDHILANSNLVKQCVKCYIDKIPRGWDRPSDHAPVVAEFDS